MYVLAPNATTVHVLSLNGPNNATSLGSFDFTGPFQGSGLNLDPNNLQGMAVYVKPAGYM